MNWRLTFPASSRARKIQVLRRGVVRVASKPIVRCFVRLALLSLSLGLHRLSDHPRAIKTIQRFS